MAEGVLQFNVASMVENLLQQHGKRLHDIDLAARKAQEASLRRYEAAGWLRKMVGVVAGKDLPAEPSEEHFRVGLRSGTIFCNVLNKVHPGATAKVVEASSDTVTIPNENVRNFLAAIEEMGIPTFEVSDLEQKLKNMLHSAKEDMKMLQMKHQQEFNNLGGQAKTLMFVHISPEYDALGETLSTLKFAERVSTVELGAARTNKDNTDVKELKEQIASLKAALARKEGGESDALQHSRPSSPDPQRLRSSGSSPSNSSWNSPGDSCKAEEQTNSSSPSRRHSLDPQDLMNSPSWPPLGNSPSLTELGKGVSREWVDKVLMNKSDSSSGDTDLGKWEEEGRKSSEIFYQKQRMHNTSKVYPEKSPSKIPERRRHSLDNGLARTKYQQIAIDDSDDHEVATSDSSEPDNQSQLNKSSSLPSVIGSKLRKPSPKSTRSQEVRSLIPPPTRKVSSGVQSSLQKTMRQPTSAVPRRKPVGGK
ncbi:UNVERIFIED_CONTAM: Kinesin-like protein KIN-14I [Sesamum latifolium]|uniref:Kinesin-like protein KIN-14I n=1 Tax=Sesamum latifolium TaxID=2727402 RepID=A0AAW2XPR7_9LAMI